MVLLPYSFFSQFARILLQIRLASSGQSAEIALLQESRIGAKKLAVVVKVCFISSLFCYNPRERYILNNFLSRPPSILMVGLILLLLLLFLFERNFFKVSTVFIFFCKRLPLRTSRSHNYYYTSMFLLPLSTSPSHI